MENNQREDPFFAGGSAGRFFLSARSKFWLVRADGALCKQEREAMRRRNQVFTVVMLFLFFGSAVVFADTILLKSGEKIEGTITQEDEYYIMIKSDGIVLPFNKDEIAQVTKQEAAAAQGAVNQRYAQLESNRVEALAALDAEDYQRVAESLEKDLKLAPRSSAVAERLAYCYFRMGQYEKVINLLPSNVLQSSESGIGYAVLGLSYKALGDKDQSRQALLQHVEFLKSHAKTSQEKGRAFILEKILE